MLTELFQRLTTRQTAKKSSCLDVACELADRLLVGAKIPDDEVETVLNAAGVDLSWLETRLKLLQRHAELTANRSKWESVMQTMPGLTSKLADLAARKKAFIDQIDHESLQVATELNHATSAENQWRQSETEFFELQQDLERRGAPAPVADPFPNRQTDEDVVNQQMIRAQQVKADHQRRQAEREAERRQKLELANA